MLKIHSLLLLLVFVQENNYQVGATDSNNLIGLIDAAESKFEFAFILNFKSFNNLYLLQKVLL